MTAANHALTGTAIGFVVGQPWLAVPAAVASHYLCDAIPHFGVSEGLKQKILKTNAFRNYLIVEALLCFLIVLGLALLRPNHWLLAAVCAFAAAAPDLLSYRRYRAARTNRPWQPNLYERFAHAIQWFELPIGAVVEVAWLIAMLVIIRPFLVK